MIEFCRLLVVSILVVFSVRAHESDHDYIAANATQTIVSQTYLNHPFETGTEGNVSRRLLSAKWQPIRIHLETSDLTQRQLPDADKKLLHYITSSIFPLVTKILVKHLNVIRVDGNLKIGKHSYTCHGIPIPESDRNIGIANTDFVAYLTIKEYPKNSSTLASSVPCKLDQHGRPVAGYLALNLEFLRRLHKRTPTNYVVSVLAHEMSHNLGWTSWSFRNFRDEFGNLRKNVITFKNTLGKKTALLSTPAVTKYVRQYFGCDSLTGLELEDGHGQVPGSHPEKRIFPESYMAATIETKSNYIIDAMALSVFQDSGWYQVKHLEQAGQLSWGRGMGCDVATKKCNAWGPESYEKGMFCNDQKQHFCLGHSKQAFGYCDLSHHDSGLPKAFHYFPHKPHLGGHSSYADYCPRGQENWYADCTDPENAGKSDMHDPGLGSRVGPDSRCFLSSLENKEQGIRTAKDPYANCFRRTCKPATLNIHIGDHTVSCPVSTQATTLRVKGYRGHVVCPPYTGIEDVRCRPTCSNNDPECLGAKGSVLDTTFDQEPVVVHGRLRH